MGCDIHCYIEYRKPDRDTWSDFGGRINPGRNYWMFGFMGGVRADFPHIEPRGFPLDSGFTSFNDNSIYVDDNQKEPYENFEGEYHYSREHAEECVAKGYCSYLTRGEFKNRWISNSDHHSHSWLTPDEFELAIAAYLKQSGFQINTPRLAGPSETSSELDTASSDFNEKKYALSSITEYWAILAAMRCLEAQGNLVRLNFWFDN